MIPKKTQPIRFSELIFTAIVLTLALIFLEKSWLSNSFSPLPIINVQLEQIK